MHAGLLTTSPSSVADDPILSRRRRSREEGRKARCVKGSGERRERGAREAGQRWHGRQQQHNRDDGLRAQCVKGSGKTQIGADRAGPARHEDPALPLRERELNPIARGPTDHESIKRDAIRPGDAREA